MGKQVFYLSGVPRSGSTVLASMLNQNPDFYVTQTSPVLDVLNTTSSSWPALSANVLNQDPAQLKNILNGIWSNSYSHIQTPYVIDKHRGWAGNIRYIKNITGISPKIICTTRDVSEIIASFLMLIEKEKSITYIDKNLLARNKPINTATRARILWEDYIRVPWQSLKKGWEQDRECMLFLDYKDIINNPEASLTRIYNFLEIPEFKGHTFVNLSPMKENDTAWGLKNLHNIRPNLRKTSPPAQDILGKNLAEYYNSLSLEFWR